jgi:hypothetical protein
MAILKYQNSRKLKINQRVGFWIYYYCIVEIKTDIKI